MIKIKILGEELMEVYEEFLLKHSYTLLYHSSKYIKFLIEVLGCQQQTLIALDENEDILAVLPLLTMEGSYGKAINSLPFYGSNGGLIGDDKNARLLLIDAYNKLVKSQEVAVSTIVQNPLFPSSYQEVLYDLVDKRIGQFTPLVGKSETKELLMKSFHQKTRNMIRKSEKIGVTVFEDHEALPFLKSIHEENMIEIGGIPKPSVFFDTISKYFILGKDYKLYTARIFDEPVAALLVFFYNKTVEYYTPVIKKEYRETQALSGIIFHAMCEASKSGYEWWNWGGTWLTQDGVYRFKSRWGTKALYYQYFTYVNNPSILKSNRSELLSSYPFFFTVPFSELFG